METLMTIKHGVLVLLGALLCLSSVARAQNAEVQREHPYLMFHANELDNLRRKFNDPHFADHKAILLKEAELLMTFNGENAPPGATPLPPARRIYRLAGQRKQPVMNILPWAYVFTGKAEYKDTFLAVMQFDFDRINKGDLIFDSAKFS
jgi:hypothetical protein